MSNRWDVETRKVPRETMAALVYGATMRPTHDYEGWLFVILASATALLVAVTALIVRAG